MMHLPALFNNVSLQVISVSDEATQFSVGQFYVICELWGYFESPASFPLSEIFFVTPTIHEQTPHFQFL